MMLLFITHRYKPKEATSTEVAPQKDSSSTEITFASDIIKSDVVDTRLIEEYIVKKKPLSSMPFRLVKLALCGLCLSCYATGELGWFGFSSAMYQYLPDLDEMDATKAAHVQSVLSATFTSGRLLTAFITLRLVPDVIITYHYVVAFVALGTLYFGRGSLIAIYIGSALLGKFFNHFYSFAF